MDVRPWSEEEFAGSREVWDGLLAATDADPLFLSWDWQWRWWLHHAPLLQASLRVLGVYASGALVGVAPFYLRRVRVRGVLPLRRLELIGTAWRHPRAAFSDYLDIIAARDQRASVRDAIGRWLEAERAWDDVAFCCTPCDGVASELTRQRLSGIAHVREVDEMTGWRATLPTRFDEFVERLSSDVRRKILYQRRKLSSPRIEYATEGDIPEYLDALSRYSSARWGRGSEDATAQHAFQCDVAACMARSGRLRLSRLTDSAGPLSILYSVLAGETVYYLQSGFDAARARGVSPGYLHFGYAIEAACEEGARRFDFLAGPGLHRDYKRDLLTERVAVVSYHVIRQPLARMLHAAHGALKRCRKSLHLG